MSLTRIEEASEDILVKVFSFLTIYDMIPFQCASRAMHSQGDNPLLWHQLLPTFRLPLPISLPDALNLSIPDLRRLFNRATKLERNLLRYSPALHRAAEVHSRRCGDALAVASDEQNSHKWSLISFHRDAPSLAVNTYNGDRCENEKEVILPVPGLQGSIHERKNRPQIVMSRYKDQKIMLAWNEYPGKTQPTYSFYVYSSNITSHNSDGNLTSFTQMSKVMLQLGSATRPKCCGRLTGVVAKTDDNNHKTASHVLLFNHFTGEQVIYKVPRQPGTEHTELLVYRKHFVLLHMGGDTILVRSYRIPECLLENYATSVTYPLDYTIQSSATSFAPIQLPPALDTFSITANGVIESDYIISTHDGLLDTAFSLCVHTTGQLEHPLFDDYLIYTISLPYCIIAPDYTHDSIQSRITAPFSLLYPEPRTVRFRPTTLTALGRAFTVFPRNTGMPGAQHYVELYISNSSLGPSSTSLVRWHNTGAVANDRALLRIQIAGASALFDPDVWYDQGKGRLCLPYYTSGPGRLDESLTLHMHMWDLIRHEEEA